MGGAQIAIILSLVSFAATMFNVAREVLWRGSTTPEWAGWVALAISIVAVLVALAITLAAFGKAPRWVRRVVETLVSPADLKSYPDMPIRKLSLRLSPDLVEGYDLSSVGQGQFERIGELVRELRQHARLGRLVIWGRKSASEGFEDHTPLSEMPVDFWETGSIDYLTAFGSGKGKAERKIGRDKEWYVDLHLNEQQVNKLYKSGTSLRLRVPWERTSH
jgi:hypothetical protein